MANPQKDFWSQVNKTLSCWLWTGRTDKDGYGKYRHRLKKLKAHRFSYEDTFGSIPSGKLVLHKCDNPPCVRPEHLFLGTHKDNTQDMISKGRRADLKPPVQKPYKVTDDVLNQVRTLRAEGLTQKQIASKLGLHQSYVSKLLRK